MGAEKQVVLVVEPSRADAAGPWALLEADGFSLEHVSDAPEALLRARDADVGAVLLDLGNLGELGRLLLGDLRGPRARAHLPVIALCASGDASMRRAALHLGADDAVDGPGDEELVLRLRRALALGDQVAGLVKEVEALRHLSVTDALTETHNHRFFQDRLKEEFRRAQRHDDALSLILVDIDHFKAVNDRHGHPAGDRVLKDVARCIRGAVRDTDLVCRYGGEEFAVLLPRTAISGALTVADRVWRSVGALETGPAGAVRVTVSAGVSSFPGRQVLSADQLLLTADEALYRAKGEGRNRICVHQQLPFFLEPPARAR